jgi:hypothetical protein
MPCESERMLNWKEAQGPSGPSLQSPISKMHTRIK